MENRLKKFTLYGSLIGLGFYIVLYGLLNLILNISEFCISCLIILVILTIPCRILDIIGIPCLISGLIFWTIIGALIGLLISKIKK